MSCGRWPPLRNRSTSASTLYAVSGRVCSAIAQTKPESSRAIAAVITVFNFPAWASLRYRRQNRPWAFQAMSRIGLLNFSWRRRRSQPIRAGNRQLNAASINMRRAAPLPALVIPPGVACFRWNARKEQTQIGHELPRIGETGDVAEFRHQRRRGHQREATQRLQRLHHWRQRPIRQRGFDVGFKMIPPSRRRLDGRDAIFQHDVMRCVFERQSGEPAPVHRVQAGRS